MNRVIALITLVAICLCISSCGKDESGSISDSNTGSSSFQSQPTTVDDETETSPDSNIDNHLAETAKVGGQSIYIDYSSSRRSTSKYKSLVFHNSKADVISLAYDKDISFTGSSQEAFNLLNDGIVFEDMDIYAEADFREKTSSFIIAVDEREDTTVEGINVTRFQGNVTDNNNRVCFVYGYAFVTAGVPCLLIGVDSSSNQDEVLQKSIIEEVNLMMHTIRNER